MCGTERDILASSGHGKLMLGAEGVGKWARLNAEGKEKTLVEVGMFCILIG